MQRMHCPTGCSLTRLTTTRHAKYAPVHNPTHVVFVLSKIIEINGHEFSARI
jgi:hypothetical protein